MVNLQGVQIILSNFSLFRFAIFGLGMVILGACASLGEDHPITQKFNWFAHLGGADIRAACQSGAPDRYRFVYNGIYVEQVRSYDDWAEAESRVLRVKFSNSHSVDPTANKNVSALLPHLELKHVEEVGGRRLAPPPACRSIGLWGLGA